MVDPTTVIVLRSAETEDGQFCKRIINKVQTIASLTEAAQDIGEPVYIPLSVFTFWDSLTPQVVTAATTFDSFDKLPEDLASTAAQVNKFAGYYVHLEANHKYFDWDGFAPAVTKYPGKDLVGVSVDTKGARGVKHCKVKDSDLDVAEIERDDNASNAPDFVPGPFGLMPVPGRGPKEISLDNVLGWVVDTLHDVLTVKIEKSELKTTITNVFTNLEWSHSSGFLSSSSSGSNTAWEYRTVYKYAGDDHPDKFQSMVTSIVLSADVSKVSNLMLDATKSHFNSHIKVAKLEVIKGFESPV
ncbi:hypothetical protein NEOLEDRAFT_1168319 [Neolentinus lepideus HHB14362 ss-1]|uniref:Delta-endotoxin CytB n=1 Tax=Neolentinus lepideus HHB14362 ss-1 TaxID=1314782 RepID=A0A165TTQ4_9AGAM|nr:hypothetical protein NEOLEDRAFT_1168319 [Neolentinus lepideus HHB14362 ss-1]